ncbi:hypothetical protein BBta_5195 [Bradyrhizobium sp. BTAi1]|nr:hypothetical protein BBta_5195 [Bradyrhizobium sp. BTAi1]
MHHADAGDCQSHQPRSHPRLIRCNGATSRPRTRDVSTVAKTNRFNRLLFGPIRQRDPIYRLDLVTPGLGHAWT